MSRNRFPPSALWFAFALPLICFGLVLIGQPIALGVFLPFEILITLGIPLGIASIGFGVAAVVWQLTAKGYFDTRLSEARLQSLPLTMALIAGLLPLLSAGIIMAGWLCTRDSVFEAAGMLNILIGLVVFGFGVGSVTWHLLAYGTASIRVLKVRIPVWGVALLLISNFPVAYACVSYALSGID